MKTGEHPYHGLTVHFVTQHRKGACVEPALAKLSLAVKELEVNTDQFGTFSGEVQRMGTVLETLQKKIQAGASADPDQRLYLASEGSFIPHPHFPSASLNEEALLLYDAQEHRSIAVTFSSPRTNTAQIVATQEDTVREFLGLVGFPQAGVILRPLPGSDQPLDSFFRPVKDVESTEEVLTKFTELKEGLLGRGLPGRVEITTDHRAHRNPLRQVVIEQAAQLLVRRLCSFCPRCQAIGFWGQRAIKGLPCEVCESPTELIQSVEFGCDVCGFTEERPREDGRARADSAHCSDCNP